MKSDMRSGIRDERMHGEMDREKIARGHGYVVEWGQILLID